MFKNSIKFFALTLLTSLLLLAALNSNVISVKAQGQATVNVLDSIGGTTDPAAGTTTPADGTPVTLTASDNSGFIFQYWIISTSSSSNVVYDNPTSITVSGGVTYSIQALFQPIELAPGSIPVTNQSTAAIIVVLAAAGGTTTPAPGTYQLADTSKSTLTATADSGWQFSHWVISGMILSHGGYPFDPVPTNNPYPLDHGYGYTYNYQPVFTPTGITEPTPTPTATPGIGGLSTDTAIIIGLVAVIIIILIAFGIFAMRKNKK